MSRQKIYLHPGAPRATSAGPSPLLALDQCADSAVPQYPRGSGTALAYPGSPCSPPGGMFSCTLASDLTSSSAEAAVDGPPASSVCPGTPSGPAPTTSRERSTPRTEQPTTATLWLGGVITADGAGPPC